MAVRMIRAPIRALRQPTWRCGVQWHYSVSCCSGFRFLRADATWGYDSFTTHW